MKISKKEIKFQPPLVNPVIDLERPLEYLAIKCLNTPGDNDSESYEINLP